MHVFFDARQKDSMPGMNFAFHCETPLSQEYPFLLRCPKIEAGIKECQARGKQVLLSLGGATGGYGFKNDAEAKLFAQRVWDLVLGGDKLKKLRPFGSAVLDGVDLDIEGGSHIGYTQFTRTLRRCMDADHSKTYIIAAAPQCPFPD
uniref:chitinase n=2 Tax=Clytia hemisphaerica TaxID=252671 RepID=A0A7M6DLR9_9CNID